MHDLTPLTALGDTTPRRDTIGAITCTEVSSLALASVTARKNRRVDCTKRLETFIGATPPPVQTVATSASHQMIWSGPDQWIITTEGDNHTTLATDLKTTLGAAASVTDQTDVWAIFDLTGADLNPALERLCNVNLHGFGPTTATPTSIHHMRCLLVGQPQGVRLFAPRSSAGSLHHAVLTTLRAL